MEHSIFFSIIIPTYNRAHLILNTLQTVFSQQFKNYEVIVVDNASTDGTVELLSPYVKTGQLNLVVHDKNYERAKSRNTGQQHAKGLYITFLDSDDLMYPTNLQDAYNYAIAHPDIMLFHNLYEMVDVHCQVVYNFQFKPLIENPLREIARGNFLSCIGVFVHHNIYKTVSWDETPILVGSEDYDYWLRVIAKVKIVGRINKVNSGILHHEERTMNRLDVQAAVKRVDYLLHKVSSDSELSASYGPYLKTMRSSLYLFLAGLPHANMLTPIRYLGKALGSNFQVLKSRSLYSSIYRLIYRFINKSSK